MANKKSGTNLLARLLTPRFSRALGYKVRKGNAVKLLNETFSLIEDELLDGNCVKIKGFGAFYVEVRRAYTI